MEWFQVKLTTSIFPSQVCCYYFRTPSCEFSLQVMGPDSKTRNSRHQCRCCHDALDVVLFEHYRLLGEAFCLRLVKQPVLMRSILHVATLIASPLTTLLQILMQGANAFGVPDPARELRRVQVETTRAVDSEPRQCLVAPSVLREKSSLHYAPSLVTFVT